jgi:hypothetical protein
VYKKDNGKKPQNRALFENVKGSTSFFVFCSGLIKLNFMVVLFVRKDFFRKEFLYFVKFFCFKYDDLNI